MNGRQNSKYDGRRGTTDGGFIDRLPLTKYALYRINLNEVCPKQTLVKLNHVNNGMKPLFVIHPIEGHVECFKQLSANLPCPVYGLQMTADTPLSSMSELATFYLQHIFTVDSTGPYTLAGYSGGCSVALEMATQLQQQHPDRPDIVRLIMLDGSHCIKDDIVNNFSRIFHPSTTMDQNAIYMIFFISGFTSVDMLDVYRQLSKSRDWEHLMETVSDTLMRTHMIGSREDVKNLAGLFWHLIMAIQNQQPATFVGDITLILAKQSFLLNGTVGRDYGLHKVCDGKVHIVEVEGDHESFLMEENALSLAEIITSLLP